MSTSSLAAEAVRARLRTVSPVSNFRFIFNLFKKPMNYDFSGKFRLSKPKNQAFESLRKLRRGFIKLHKGYKSYKNLLKY